MIINILKKLLKNIKSEKPFMFYLYINKNGIFIKQNKYYSGVSHYKLYGIKSHAFKKLNGNNNHEF
tara:strand:+ start:424 stop:621 length:198 start_codon:yes stop_codon:yes gene_type:complete